MCQIKSVLYHVKICDNKRICVKIGKIPVTHVITAYHVRCYITIIWNVRYSNHSLISQIGVG